MLLDSSRRRVNAEDLFAESVAADNDQWLAFQIEKIPASQQMEQLKMWLASNKPSQVYWSGILVSTLLTLYCLGYQGIWHRMDRHQDVGQVREKPGSQGGVGLAGGRDDHGDCQLHRS